MYQAVVVEGHHRLKLASFPTKTEALNHVLAQRGDFSYEIVDDRTALLKTTITKGVVEQILTPTTRPIA